MAKIVFIFLGCSILNFLKCVSSFGPTVFLSCFRMCFSICGVISPTECATPGFGTNKIRCHRSGKIVNGIFA